MVFQGSYLIDTKFIEKAYFSGVHLKDMRMQNRANDFYIRLYIPKFPFDEW